MTWAKDTDDAFDALTARYRPIPRGLLDAAPEPEWESAETAELGRIHLLDYERYVERPRRANPAGWMYEILLAEALADAAKDERRAA